MILHLAIMGIFFGLIGELLFPSTVVAEVCEAWVAKAVSVQGSVQVRKVAASPWTAVQRHDTFCPGDIIRVRERSRLAIVAQNETVYRLDENTTVTIAKIEPKQTLWLHLRTGAAYFFSRIPRSLKVITPFVNAGVEGTEFFVKVERDQTFLSVFEGRVIATNTAGSLTLDGGHAAVVKAGQAPTPRVVIRPRDAVQWALYYPPIVDFREADFPGEAAWQEMLRQSISFYRKGLMPEAFAKIAGAPRDIQDPRFFTYRSALLLTVGRVDTARADLENALKLDPHNSHAIALQALLAVVHNRRDAALQLAQKAVELEPTSSAARVALSYAQQVRFDLPGALASLKVAVDLPTENALAWARLAEISLSVADLNSALDAAHKAVALNPQLARTQTVLGFAFLSQVKTRDAEQAFDKAIQLDQAAPLPRLGLGLAQIRRGKLQEGRENIEIAASLDPSTSLIHSYLGKAYFEEKRDKQAQDQFTTAKELDARDPTPWFYDAIRQQTVNRPVEALQDLQQSMALNDNRAIYRSRLLLDEDLAARGASLARIYDDLGFQQYALVEGWKSLQVDPGNASAHRFLSDSYAVLPRHEIARVSELLQSQLLQPLSITPVQPQLAESELFILSGAGPADPASNEFNPLFNRNRFALLASGVLGGNNTLGDEVVLSGVSGKLSYSLGQFHYETDGFRENNDLEQTIYNVFVQAALSYRTSIQTEFRYTDSEKGDLPLRFDPNNFSADFRQKDHIESLRFGLRHIFTPHSSIIASIIYENRDIDASLARGVSSIFNNEGYLAEAQHLFRSRRLKLMSGIGHFDVNRKTAFTFSPFLSDARQTNIHHTNLYVYAQINYPQHVTWTLGGSADFFANLQEGALDGDQFSPKFGLIWNPFPTTTLRAAIFRTFRRSLISGQTIEPTQVAGFNQFFDDAEGTDAWRYGIGIDQTLTAHLYAGAEFSRRDLNIPSVVLGPGTSTARMDGAEEDLARLYLNWAPLSWLVFSGEYLYERFKKEFPNPTTIKTQRVPLGIRFFHPSGFSAQMRAIYVDQYGDFVDSMGRVAPSGDHFWLLDALLQYRLPKRWGFITVEGKNLFDERFRFEDTDPGNPTILPERLILARFTFSY